MPRTRRASKGGYCYRVLNRGNARRTVFHKDGDYVSFLNLLHEAGERTPIRLLSYCLMPNHFHLAVRPRNDSDLSDFKKKRGHSTFSLAATSGKNLRGQVW